MGIMNFSKRPNKRMRLDLESNIEGNVANEDLWGQDDITADEFDMLEFQATQSIPIPPVTNNISLQVADISRQKQYELEGKIKILSDSIELSKKELAEEKVRKNKAIAEKTREFEEKEKMLQKQIQKLLSSLQFKDQEMIAVHDKVKTLEVQLKENKVNAKASTSKSSNKYFEKFDFTSDTSVQASEAKLLHQKVVHHTFALSVDTPKGQTQSCDIISSILCNRLFPLQIPFHSPLHNQFESNFLSPVSVTKFSLEQKPDDIFHYYTSILENYVSFIQNFSDQTNSNSSMFIKNKDLNYTKTVVISCLKDLSYIISCSDFSDAVNSLHIKSLVQEAKKASQTKGSSSSSSTSSSPNCDKKLEREYGGRKMRSLLTLLFTLSRPDIYPNGFACREEVEWSLSVLVSWSATNSKSFVGSFNNAVITSHISNCFSNASTNLVLRLLINICTLKEYLSKSIHKNDTCHLCAIATLLTRTISNSPLECIDMMILVLDLLSSMLSVHTFSDMKLEGFPCSMMILQAVLATVLKFYKIRKGDHDLTLLLKKGFTLLHYLSKYIPNLKLRRVDFDDLYISTVCVILNLSKEDPSFKDFQEIAHELWDFQEDTSEFDLEDLSDDSMPAVNLKSQNDS